MMPKKEKEKKKKDLENIKFEMLTDKRTMNSLEEEAEKEKEKPIWDSSPWEILKLILQQNC